MVEMRFRAPNGQLYGVEVNEATTVSQIKGQLEQLHGIPSNSLNLILHAQVLQDSVKAGEIPLPFGSYIALHTTPAPRAVPDPPAEIASAIADRRDPPVMPVVRAQPSRSVATGSLRRTMTDPAATPAAPPPSARSTLPPPRPAPMAPPPPAAPAPAAAPAAASDFAARVSTLSELGFEPSQCEAALRATNGDLERATELILSGGLPAAPRPPPADAGASPYGPLQGVFDGLSSAEKTAVRRLSQLNRDPVFVLEMYMACEKNERQARYLIS
jgi:hypothetical protein